MNRFAMSLMLSGCLMCAVSGVQAASGGAAIGAIDRSGAIAAVASSPVASPAATPGLSVSPTQVNAGGKSFTLTVNGAHFTPNSVITWNGTPQPTTYVSPTVVTALVLDYHFAVAGTAVVAVQNPSTFSAAATTAAGSATVVISGAVPANARFVALSGSDANAGTLARPYRTIQKCATSVPVGSTCEVEAGTYYETVTPNSGVTITAYNGQAVTVTGANPIGGWTQYKGSIYEAPVTMGTEDGNQVFVNGVMMPEARYPNGNDVMHVNWGTLKSGTNGSAIVDSSLPNINWTGARVHFWSGTDPWNHMTGKITGSGSGRLSYQLDGAAFCPYICVINGGYYYVYGVLGALDSPGEWYYDSVAHKIYLWAPGGVNPNTVSVSAKQRQYAFDLSGRSNVTIQYINLFASSINMNAASSNNLLNGINVKYVSHFTTLADTHSQTYSAWNSHVSDTGIILNGSGNRLLNSSIAYSAGTGVSVLGTRNTVSNNLIHDVDYIGNYSAGISLAGGDHEIDHNTIYDSGRSAVWPTYQSTAADDISYNNFYGGMLLLRDGAEIYVSHPGPSGSTIHHNWLHDTQSRVPGPADNYALSGIYLDEDANNYQVYQNVFWNNAAVSIYVNGSTTGTTVANNNRIYNNSVPDVNPMSFVWFGGGTHIQSCGYAEVVNNFVLVAVRDTNNPACTVTGNSAYASGATEMTNSIKVGCNFAGCTSSGPPAVVGNSVAASIAAQPYNRSVSAGQTATFSVIGGGSGPLRYQWKRNGAAISGATKSTYTTAATSAGDNGAQFTVTVSNDLAQVTSAAATLTVD